MLKAADRAVLEQAILRHKELEARRKMEFPITKGLGSIVVGTVFDCNRDKFEQMLRAYWDRLYVGWNPFKNEGNGCWEVWARPSKKTPVFEGIHDGMEIWTLQNKPNDFEHWVADLPFLSYDFIKKLKDMDSWENKNQVADHEYEYERSQQKAEDKEEENIKYVVKHNKQLFRDLLDYTQQGFDPVQFFYKGKK